MLCLALIIAWATAPVIVFGQQWKTVAELPEPRAGAAAAELDGYIYVIGGRSHQQRATASVYRYHVATGEWSDDDGVPDLDEARVNAAAVALGRKIFVIGGRGVGGEILQTVEVFDPAANEWLDFPDTKRQREGAAAVVLGGSLYLIGGSDQGERALDTIERFDEVEDRWEEISEWRLDRARVSSAATVVGSSAFVFGGFNTFGPVGQVQQFDATSGSVTSIDMNVARGALAVAAYANRIFVIGGRSQDRVLDITEIFDPARKTWSPGPRLVTARFGHSASTVGDSIFVVGGLGAQGVPLSTIEMLVATGTARENVELPPDLSLGEPFPNPFYGITEADYSVTASGSRRVTIEVIDVLGRTVRTLVDEMRVPGNDRLRWAGDTDGGSDAAAGLYFIRMRQGPFTIVRKVVRVSR